MSEVVPNARGVRRRQDIVDAAAGLFGEIGFRGASMAAIATRAGVTHAGLLYHFATKDDVLEAVLTEEADRGRSVLSDADAPADADHLRRLETLMARKLDEPDRARLWSMLLGESVGSDHPLRHRMAERYDGISTRLQAHLAGLAAEGEAGPAATAAAGRAWSEDDLASVSRLLIATMDGLQFQMLTGAESDLSRDFSVMVDMVRAGLARADDSSTEAGSATF